VLLYCGGGVSASMAFLALRTAGYRDLRVYDGSWSEWSLDPEAPQERH
jgi:thiosulfate/3-mercaptopyruvate sulfurtransferase